MATYQARWWIHGRIGMWLPLTKIAVWLGAVVVLGGSIQAGATLLGLPLNVLDHGILLGIGLATLLIDLLTADEEAAERHTGHLRFDIGLLAERLIAATRWLEQQPATRSLGLGYFGASTGGGAALVAAAAAPTGVHAVVSRGGRPDLAGEALPEVRAPTLLIVGGHDSTVLGLNRSAMARMQADTRLEIVPGASHLFEEPGALQTVARLAADWFVRYLHHRSLDLV
jgi:putative phosphoribosyl transferase